MKFKSFPAEFKVDMDKNEFEGYASTFGNKDGGGDIVEQGAFAKTLKEHGHRVKVLWQHDPWSPIGKPLEMREDSRGLHTRSKVSETEKGKEALVLMRDGVIDELSIGYDVIKSEPDEERDANILKEIRLWEYSPVTWAMNELAVITGVKSVEEIKPMLDRVNAFQEQVKEGRVLSESNVRLVREAIEALKAVLEAAEPEKSTQQNGDKGEPGDHSSEDAKQLLDAISPLRELKKGKEAERLVDELRDFGKQLREVN